MILNENQSVNVVVRGIITEEDQLVVRGRHDTIQLTALAHAFGHHGR